MVRVIVTTCGKLLRRTMLPMDALRRQNMCNAIIGCGTLDDGGLYVEIEKVYFVKDLKEENWPLRPGWPVAKNLIERQK